LCYLSFCRNRFVCRFLLPGDSLLFLAIYNRINRKCAFIDSSFVNVLIYCGRNIWYSRKYSGVLVWVYGYYLHKKTLFGSRKNILCSLKISLTSMEELLFLPGSYLYSELLLLSGIVTMDKKRSSCTTM
jgi:hypothetical protein